jgi:hypothetical protein
MGSEHMDRGMLRLRLAEARCPPPGDWPVMGAVSPPKGG